jgi:hypothetical protein
MMANFSSVLVEWIAFQYFVGKVRSAGTLPTSCQRRLQPSQEMPQCDVELHCLG